MGKEKWYVMGAFIIGIFVGSTLTAVFYNPETQSVVNCTCESTGGSASSWNEECPKEFQRLLKKLGYTCP